MIMVLGIVPAFKSRSQGMHVSGLRPADQNARIGKPISKRLSRIAPSTFGRGAGRPISPTTIVVPGREINILELKNAQLEQADPGQSDPIRT